MNRTGSDGRQPHVETVPPGEMPKRPGAGIVPVPALAVWEASCSPVIECSLFSCQMFLISDLTDLSLVLKID